MEYYTAMKINDLQLHAEVDESHKHMSEEASNKRVYTV